MTGETGMKKTKKLPIGISDFKDLVTGDYLYVDKTLFIKEILDRGDKILLIPRPRRFGKTLNLSMLKYFYDCCPDTRLPNSPPPEKDGHKQDCHYRHLFDNLAIQKAGDEYREKMGKHPVIFLSFKDIKELDWKAAFSKMIKLIRKEYARHYYLLQSPSLESIERDYFQTIIDLKGNIVDYENSLEKLLFFLSRHYRKRAVILIDEYDTPIHAGFNHDYYKEMANFIGNFLCRALKDTDQYLEKSVLIGIIHIATTSLISDFNHPGVYTLLAEEFDDKFGFTEKEMDILLRDFQLTHMVDRVREWYNGYRFGQTVIYNPWSIINFLASKSKELAPYWINTSDNQLVETLLTNGGKELKEELEQLIRGETIEKAISDNLILKDVPRRENLLWTFLLMGGYLKQTAKRRDEAASKVYYSLSIPNKEVRETYTAIVDNYFSAKIENKKLEIMLKALIDGDIKLFEKMLRKVVLAVFSYHDFGGEPEKVYHALVAGLLIWISNTHELKSNRESGYGRYDIMIIPREKNGMGYVMEFKTVDTDENETVQEATEAALKQIEEKKYETELIERGIDSGNIKKLAVVFRGKEVSVKEAVPSK